MKLSEFEIQVLQLFWSKENGSAPEIHEKIAKVKDVTYSTVKTIIDRLEKKKAIERTHQEGRKIFYSAVISASELQKPMLDNFITKVFGGNKKALLNHLLNENELTNEDAMYLKELLKKNRK